MGSALEILNGKFFSWTPYIFAIIVKMLKTQNIDTMTFCLGTRGARVSELTNESLLLMTNKKTKQSWSKDFLDSPELNCGAETTKIRPITNIPKILLTTRS